MKRIKIVGIIEDRISDQEGRSVILHVSPGGPFQNAGLTKTLSYLTLLKPADGRERIIQTRLDASSFPDERLWGLPCHCTLNDLTSLKVFKNKNK